MKYIPAVEYCDEQPAKQLPYQRWFVYGLSVYQAALVYRRARGAIEAEYFFQASNYQPATRIESARRTFD